MAVINASSHGSSWQMSELDFGCGLAGSGFGRAKPRPRPVFIYPATDKLVGYLASLEKAPSVPVYLKPDPQAAATRVAEALRTPGSGQPAA